MLENFTTRSVSGNTIHGMEISAHELKRPLKKE